MNTRHAQLVLAVVREGSFTAAAKSLFITQPTLSHQIRQIEEQLGSPIFVRSKTAIELTPAGHVYVQAARRILQIETQMNEALGALSGTSEGILRLGLPAQRADELLPQVLADFYALYPNVRIEALTAQQQELERMLLGGELHMALLSGDEDNPQLEYQLIASDEVVLFRQAKRPSLPSASPPVQPSACGNAPKNGLFSLLTICISAAPTTSCFLKSA